jgi:hypothetical protein
MLGDRRQAGATNAPNEYIQWQHFLRRDIIAARAFW